MTRDDDATSADDALRSAADAVRGATQVALGVPREPRRRRARLDARRCTTCCGPPGCDVVASFPTPFVTAPHYRELPGLDAPRAAAASSRASPTSWSRSTAARSARLGDLEPAAKARARARRHRPPHLERPVRHDQRHRPRRRRERLWWCAGSSTRWASPLNQRRRGLPLRRARLRHRPLPVRHHDARGVRARARELVDVRRPGRAAVRARSSRSTASRTCSCSARRSAAPSSCASSASCGPRSPRTMLERHGVTIEEVEGLIDIVRRDRGGRGRVRAQGRGRRHDPGEPALARRRRRAAHRGGARRRRAPLRRRLHVRRSTSSTVVARIRAAL